MSQDMSESKRMPPDKMSERMLDKMSENVSDSMADKMSENMTERMPDKISYTAYTG